MKRPKDMTHDELCALPEFKEFGRVTVPVVNGKATAPDGRVFAAIPGTTMMNFPRARKLRVSACGPDDILAFQSRDGKLWRPVEDEDGVWHKQEFCLWL